MDVSLVIPCYNEAENVRLLAAELTPVLTQLRESSTVELVLVDDGSMDSTVELLEQEYGQDPSVQVIRHDRNRGLGAALRTGFAHASGDVIVTTDSDATYPFSLIPPLLEQLRPDVDIVTASCYHPQGGIDDVPGYRIILSRSASIMYRLLLDRHIHTYTCMFRAYRRSVIQSVPFLSNGFLSQTELLANAMFTGYRVAELPCRLRARRYGASKARIARTILAHLRFQSQLIKQRTVGSRTRVATKRET